ncbi:MAG TPA: lipopolysaccharide kinase InaA family protein, partial [Pseudomonas sp.]
MGNLLASLQTMPQEQAFDRWLAEPGEWVEAPNERRGGMSGVQRVRSGDGRLLYRKQQVDHGYRDWRHPLGEPTVLREERA